MRQNFKAVPETDNLYPLSVQLKGDAWHVFDARTGGWTGPFESYWHAENRARELKVEHEPVRIA